MAFAEYVTALTDRDLWLDNPIALRDARRESRHNRVFNAILTLCVTVLALAGLGAWSLYYVLKYNGHVPEWLGGSFGTALAIFASGIHFWWVARAAQRRVDGMLMREASLDGMTSLLMLPISRLNLVLQAGVYPWAAAACVALLFLPVYVFCIGIDGMTWAELFALYTLFFLAAVATPGFRRPALSGNVASSMLNQADDDPGADPGSGGGLTKRKILRPTISLVALTGVIIASIVILSFIGLVTRTQPFAALPRYIPESILSLTSASIITLPLVAARAMVTPFAWFDLQLMPWVFVVILVLARKYTHVIRTSEYLSVGTYRDLAALPGYLPRRRLEASLNVLGVIVLVGYVWPWAVRDNGLDFLAVNPATPTAGLYGFVFLCLFTACMWCIARAGLLGSWRCVFSKPESEQVTRATTLRGGLVYIVSPFALVGIVFAISMVLGGWYSLPAGSFAMSLHILSVTAAGALLNFGLRRFTGPFGLAGFITSSVALWGPAPVRFLTYLSPALGMASLGPRNLFGLSARGAPLANVQSFTQWVAVMGSLGLALTGIAWVAAHVRRSRQVEVNSLTLDPTVVGREVFGDSDAELRGGSAKIDSPLSLAIVKSIQTFLDNAVLTRELRARLRSRITTGKVAGVFVSFFVACAVIYLFLPVLAYPGRTYAMLLYGTAWNAPLLARTPQTLASIQCCFYVAMSFAALICGYSVLPRAFGLDKQKNTLSSLLTTPMSTASIVLGKAVSIVITGGAAIWIITVWTLVMAVPLAVMLGALTPITGWLRFTFDAVLEYIGIAMVMLALGSLFPDLTTVRLNGCLRLIVLMMVYMAVGTLTGVVYLVATFYNVGEQALWAAKSAAGIGVIVLSATVTIGAIGGMRKGDIDIKLARRK